jgi:hypothetical protein
LSVVNDAPFRSRSICKAVSGLSRQITKDRSSIQRWRQLE